MNRIQAFNHQLFGEIRAVVLDDKPYFVGVDVARALEYSNPSKAVIDHCKGITKLGIPSPGGTQETNVIPEGDVYRLIIKAADQSRNPEIKAKAEQFERWIFDEVLPSIRKHGAYMTNETLEKALTSPDFLIQLATRLKEEQEKRIAAEQKLEEQKPLVGFAETCLASKDSILVRELAKVASKQGITIGQNRLYKKLREWGLIMPGSTEPYQHAIDAGYFEVVQSGKETVAGYMIFRTTRVTPKGQVYIIDRLKREYQAVGKGGR